MNKQPSFSDISAVMAYDPKDGLLISRRSGKPYGYIGPQGYLRVFVSGKIYAGHRLAWLLSTGSWPPGYLDHANGNRADNRLANLRLATKSENNRNRAMQRNNTSGVKGVSYCKATKRWRVRVMMDKRHISLGRFETLEQAKAAYTEAASKLHGEFASTERGSRVAAPTAQDTQIAIPVV